MAVPKGFALVIRRLSPILFALLPLLLVVPAAPAAAHPLAHPAPRVLNVRPAGGDVVPAGQVSVAALAVSGQTITESRLLVDGMELPAGRSAGSHATVAAVAELAAGDHIAEVFVRDAAGRSATRAWRFTVSALPVQRLRGVGRVETAVAVSRDLFAAPVQGAVLARADDFADALAGVPLAQSIGGPLLLSGRDALSPPSAEELRRVVVPGGTVWLLGGAAALSAQVAADVEALGFTVRRLSGSSRYATAAQIAAQLPDADTAMVVSGVSFADALAASSPAAVEGWPVLLTLPQALPAETRAALDARGVERVMVVGGTGAVSDAVLGELRGRGGEVERISGPGRYDTADRVARRFFSEAPLAALAGGERFPDALAGSRHAAAKGVPLLLAAPTRLLAPQSAYLAERQPSQAVVYGGSAAVADRAVGDVRRAVLDGAGPVLEGVQPAEGQVVSTLDEIVLDFDRELVPEHSIVFAEIGGHEVATSLGIGDFPDTLVVRVAELPGNAVAGAAHEVRVTAAVYDGQTWRHLEHRFVYRKLDLARGDTGPAVLDLQHRLMAQGFWLGNADGVYGGLTHQAVMALEKAHGLPRDGVYDAAARRIVESGAARPRGRTTAGRWMEVDLDRQILLAVLDGQVQWVFNASAGHGQWYEFNGQRFRADTTTGQRRIVREINGMREAERGQLWRPKYFDDVRGIAIHGSTSVPAHAASSGCVRVTYPAMDFIWDAGLAPVGTKVWVYPESFYG